MRWFGRAQQPPIGNTKHAVSSGFRRSASSVDMHGCGASLSDAAEAADISLVRVRHSASVCGGQRKTNHLGGGAGTINDTPGGAVGAVPLPSACHCRLAVADAAVTLFRSTYW